MTNIAMPKLSDSMEEGTIISWLKSTGDQVEVGDELCEIETDKATVAFAAEVDGVLEIVASVGNSVRVGEPIARIGAADTPTTAQPESVGTPAAASRLALRNISIASGPVVARTSVADLSARVRKRS